ncbi:hypothetical protein V2I01_31955 [Micromonospora sp. BRA006-A]|nr:hypothetical protein [Micromonospora sp. BRA006-A]
MQRDIGFRHIRGHGLPSDGVGVHRPYRQSEPGFGTPSPSVDQVVDAYLTMGIRPSWS